MSTTLLLNKHVPADVLMNMPAPFVRRLRDLKIKEIEEQQRQQQMNASSNNTSTNNGMMVSKATIDDLVDELSGY